MAQRDQRADEARAPIGRTGQALEQPRVVGRVLAATQRLALLALTPLQQARQYAETTPGSPPAAAAGYKRMTTDCSARDIVHTNLITGVHGNYLWPSLVAAGLDPDRLPISDPSQMDFGSQRDKPKAWKDIWGCGQGIGVLDDIPGAAELVDRFAAEYEHARDELQRKAA